jgi:hypothetical protein
MYKVFLTVRNRLELTKMCLVALLKHSALPNQIYVYENLTDTKVEQHFAFWYKLYEKGLISQVTFTTKDSTFNAFSKVVASNLFAFQHSQDPNKSKYDFLVLLDNDVIVTPGWDSFLREAWIDVTKHSLKEIKIITQLPGGIMETKEVNRSIAGVKCKQGKLGGSGLWSVRNDFFDKIGLLQVKSFTGISKRYDQTYWHLIDTNTGGKPYILGLDHKLGIHCGSLSYSVCNNLVKTKLSLEEAEERTDKYIAGLSFQEFYDAVSTDGTLLKEW